MKLANSACPVRERSTTVALTPLSAWTMAACLAISQDTGLLLVESYTNHLARRQNSNVCHWGRGTDHHALKERGWKVLFTHSYQHSRQAKREKVSHKSELMRHSSTGEGRGPRRGDQRQSEEVSKRTNPMPDCTHPSPSACQWFAPWEAVESLLPSTSPQERENVYGSAWKSERSVRLKQQSWLILWRCAN